MHNRIHQGHFGETFVQLLAAAAGLTVSKPTPDVTGEDFIFGYAEDSDDDPLVGARIDVQVKSWRASVSAQRDGYWRYPMERKHFNRLAGPRSIPRFLFLVLVPEHWHEYTASAAQALTVRHCAYWASLADLDPVDPTMSGRVTVSVPTSNIVSAAGLRELFGADVVEEVGA